MAKITLDNLAHSYLSNPSSEDDFALKELNHDWIDGEAYALWARRAVASRRCSTSSRGFCSRRRVVFCSTTWT